MVTLSSHILPTLLASGGSPFNCAGDLKARTDSFYLGVSSTDCFPTPGCVHSGQELIVSISEDVTCCEALKIIL